MVACSESYISNGKSQFRLRVNHKSPKEFCINNFVPVTIHGNSLVFTNTTKNFMLKDDLSDMISKHILNADLSDDKNF